MGRIRIASFVPVQSVLDSRHVVVEKQERETARKTNIPLKEYESNAKYPILPRGTKELDLPFIDPQFVRKQSGQGTNRLWIVVDSIILDVTEYIHNHPGGRQIITSFLGQECGWQWWTFHNRGIWQGIATGLRVGKTEGIENQHRRPPTMVGMRKFGFQDFD